MSWDPNGWALLVCVLLVLHGIGHVKRQRVDRCACGVVRSDTQLHGAENDRHLAAIASHRVFACRDCGALYARRLYP